MSTLHSESPAHVSAEREVDRLLEHEYDGIREYDNPIPGWWHLLFWGSVIFAVLYFFFFTFSPVAWTVQDRWEQAQAAAYLRIFGELGELEPDQATLIELMNNPRMMTVAKGMFATNCAQCHDRDGGGINGVNLTDDAYKNVRELTDILAVINKGAANGAMPAWENRMTSNERILLAAFVASLRGTTPANGKAAEGQVIPPWPQAASPAGGQSS